MVYHRILTIAPCTLRPFCLSSANVTVCIYQLQTPGPCLALPTTLPTIICSLFLWVCFCFADRFIPHMASEISQLCPTLCDFLDCSLPGSSVHGIFQARILKWVAIAFSRGSSRPRYRTQVSHIVGRCFTVWVTREVIPHISDQFRSVAQSCPTLCDPMNRSMPGLPVHHQLPEFTQTHVHRVSDAIQPSHPLSSPSPPAPNPSQH